MEDKTKVAEQPCEGSARQAAKDKFQTPEQLHKAYEALEAEFTRKSQQLAQLRREHEQLLQERGAQQKEQMRDAAVEEFIIRHPKAAGMRDELKERVVSHEGDLDGVLSAAYMDILDREYRTGESMLEDEEFIARCVLDGRIRDAVISDYLEALSRNQAPVLAVGGFIPVRNRNKAVSLDDAAKMTKEIYK